MKKCCGLIAACCLLMGFSPVANAKGQCGAKEKTLFYCATKNKKEILLCDAGKTINYSFGKINARPELSVKVPRDKATATPWNGVGRYMSDSIEVPNGNAVYSVFFSMDRMTDEHKIDAGVSVLVNDKPAATVSCIEKTIVNNLGDAELKRADQD